MRKWRLFFILSAFLILGAQIVYSQQVFLSAGHGGLDPGAVNERIGITEHEFVRYMVQRASEILVARGLKVIEVPSDLSAFEAASWINERASSTDLAIEVHLNSVACQPKNPFCTDAQGPEILYRVGDGISGRVFAPLRDEMAKSLGLRSRSDKKITRAERGSAFLWNLTRISAVILEADFIANDRRAVKMKEELQRRDGPYVFGLVNGIELVWKEAILPFPGPTPQPPPECKTIEEALDLDHNGILDDNELLNAMDYWIKQKPVPGTCGQLITDQKILDLISRWTKERPVSPPPGPVDSDRDGISDNQDQCPFQPGPPPTGCPPAPSPQDSDNDGIPDNQDNCPYEPGPAWNNGCPPTQPPPTPGAASLVASAVPSAVSISRGGYQQIIWRFRETNGVGVSITSRTGIFKSPTGQQLSGVIGPYSNDIRIPGNGTADWLDNIYLPPDVADAARSGGWSSVNLEETFYGWDDNGNSVSTTAILTVSVEGDPPPRTISPTLFINGGSWVSISQGEGVVITGTGFTPYGTVTLVIIQGPESGEGKFTADGGGNFTEFGYADCDTSVGIYDFRALDESTGVWSNSVIVELVPSPACEEMSLGGGEAAIMPEIKIDGGIANSQIESMSVRIFDLKGKLVFESDQVAGDSYSWVDENELRQRLANGVYLYVVTVRTLDGRILRSNVKKLVILR